jgi:Ca2+-binding RTX toxin-like protein
MTQHTKDNRFRGGDDLKNGLEKGLHNVLSKTELQDGAGAYNLSFAGGKSGFSYGGNQMDLGGRDEKHEADVKFIEILKNACDSNGKRIVNPELLDTKIIEKREHTAIGVPLEAKFNKQELAQINAALSSDYGRKVIDAAYKKEIKDTITHVELVIKNDIKNPEIQKELSNEVWKVRLADYHNQMVLGRGGPLVKFFNGEAVELRQSNGSTKKVSYQKDATLLNNFNDFFRSTKEYSQSSKAMENRLEKREMVLAQNYGTSPMKVTQPSQIGVKVDPKLEEVHKKQDMSKAFLDGIGMHGGAFSANMSKGVLNGDGYANTIPSGMFTNYFRPGAKEMSRTKLPDFTLDVCKIVPDSMKHGALANACYLNARSFLNIDPVVLDLTGNGLQLRNFLEDPVLFDMTNNGYKELTGWIKPGMGILVVDKNGNGKIDDVSEMISEHFDPKSGAKNGFHYLEGKGNEVWHKLRVWTSTDGKNGELKTLQELGITKFDLTKAKFYQPQAGDETGGNSVVLEATFVMNGKEHKMYDVNFKVNPLGNKQVMLPGGQELTEAVNGTKTYKAKSIGEKIDMKLLDANVAIGSSGDDTFMANDKGNWFFGGGGKNTYVGGKGNDVFVLAEKDDHTSIVGNEGFNSVVMTGNAGKYFNMGKALVQAIYGTDAGDVIVSDCGYNTFITGGHGGNVLVGSDAGSVINAGNGGDMIYGKGGDNILRAGKGDDVIYGGTGSNYIQLGAGRNMAFGNKSNDVFAITGGKNYIDGGGGWNVASFKQDIYSYNVTKDSAGRWVVKSRDNPEEESVLSNIQHFIFDDFNITVDKEKIWIVRDHRIEMKSGAAPLPISFAKLAEDHINLGTTPTGITWVGHAVGGKLEYATQPMVRVEERGNKAFIINWEEIKDVKFIPDPTYKGVAHFQYSLNGDKGSRTAISNSSEQDFSKAFVFLLKPEHPKNPLFPKQWYLAAHNIVPVWQNYTGKGVKVNIVEPKIFDYNHPNLKPNVSEKFKNSFHAKENAIDWHATQVASVLAGTRGEHGAIGVAYDATISGETSDDLTYIGNYKNFDVVNHSFSYTTPFNNVEVDFYQNIITDVAVGRNGLGTVPVWGAGNGRNLGKDANDCILWSLPYSIVVAAINKQHVLGALEMSVESFSSRGANILVSTLGTHIHAASHMLESETGEKFTNAFTHHSWGTSFAAPIVSGVVALMMEANPYLHTFDIQKILACTAKQFSGKTTWFNNKATFLNGGGMHYSHDFGFGEVDAQAAVRLAEKWGAINLKPTEGLRITEKFVSPAGIGVGVKGIVYSDTGSYRTVVVNTNIKKPVGKEVEVEIPCPAFNNVLHKVELKLSLTKKHLGDLKVALYSPSGTESVILEHMGATASNPRGHVLNNGKLDYTFSTNHFMGERMSSSKWKLKVWDKSNDQSDPAVIEAVGINALVTTDRQMIITDEFQKVASNTVECSQDMKTLNLAAASGKHMVNLKEMKGTFAGKNIAIKGGELKNVFGGDEGNIIYGNANSNILIGGRGDDEIHAVDGHNILVGVGGNNKLFSGPKADMFVVRYNPGCKDTIMGFKTGDKKEVINIARIPGVKAFKDLNLQQDKQDVRVAFAKQEIILAGTKVEDITADRFIFNDQYDHFANCGANDNALVADSSFARAIYGLDGTAG